MPHPTKTQIAAAAAVLARDWDPDGAKAMGESSAYDEWGAGIADLVLHAPVPDTLVDYLRVLEEQLGLNASSLAERELWARNLIQAVRAPAS